MRRHRRSRSLQRTCTTCLEAVARRRKAKGGARQTSLASAHLSICGTCSDANDSQLPPPLKLARALGILSGLCLPGPGMRENIGER